ncbi:hypothetical protein Gotri_022978 [Gossypium trilobum]|uniref:Uncharacterized protein n=1 Tax=Gossypium trilobum TaxID=34281 RepID=A0A7J9DHT9_9ROSI|nr:hypothetical protein [Gossypium trilobum]
MDTDQTDPYKKNRTRSSKR